MNLNHGIGSVILFRIFRAKIFPVPWFYGTVPLPVAATYKAHRLMSSSSAMIYAYLKDTHFYIVNPPLYNDFIKKL